MGVLALNPPTLYGQGHKAGGGSNASRGRRSCQALKRCLMGSVSPGYSSTTFSMQRCRPQPPSPANPLPGRRGARFGTCLLISSTRAPLCLPAGHPPSRGSCAGMLPLRSFQLEPCYTSPLHSCIAPGQIWDFALHLSDCRLKSFLFPFLPPSLSSS